jgi:hypothetical protein
MKTSRKIGLVLAVHPTSRGFGWVVFESPILPVDWGLSRRKSKRSARSLARLEQIIDRYKPTVLVFEQFDEYPARRGRRVRELYRQMIALANGRGIDTPIYSRDTIRGCFESAGAITRYDIAVSIADRIEVFRRRLPRERRRWDSEDTRQSLFDAAALALTYFAVNSAKPVRPAS